VSNVLNAPHLVSEETRNRVLEAIDALGYRPNRAARSLQAKKTYLIGYRLTDAGLSPALDVFLHRLVRTATDHGFDMTLFAPRPGQSDLDAYREVIRAGNVDGFILSETNYTDPRVEMLTELSFPFVAFGRARHEKPFPWVDVDGARGMAEVVDHLQQQGHRRIALIAWPEGSQTGDARVQGYLQGMQAAGLRVEPDLVIRCENLYSAARTAAQDMLDRDDPPTAIVTVQDDMALGVIAAALARGIEVGGELAITGFDDSPAASVSWPGLTSVRQPFEDVARSLVDLLVDRLTQPEAEPGGVMLAPHLVVRASSGGLQ
jgi:DNA-binding LacI/PurR family transcriptional regulator